MPCCTDHLSLMAGTYGSVRLSPVLTEQLRLILIGSSGLLSQGRSSAVLSSESERQPSSESERQPAPGPSWEVSYLKPIVAENPQPQVGFT